MVQSANTEFLLMKTHQVLVSANFHQAFIFSPNDSHLKTMKNAHKKLFSFSRYSNICNFFPYFPHFPDLKRQIEVE